MKVLVEIFVLEDSSKRGSWKVFEWICEFSRLFFHKEKSLIMAIVYVFLSMYLSICMSVCLSACRITKRQIDGKRKINKKVLGLKLYLSYKLCWWYGLLWVLSGWLIHAYRCNHFWWWWWWVWGSLSGKKSKRKQPFTISLVSLTAVTCIFPSTWVNLKNRAQRWTFLGSA